MQDIITRINQDLRTPAPVRTLRAEQGDTARVLQIHLQDGGKPYPLTGDCQAAFYGRKADGTILFHICELEGNTVSYHFTSQTSACPGTVDAQIRVWGADKQLLTTAPFRLEIYGAVADPEQADPVQEEMTALDALISRTAELKAELEHQRDTGAFRGESAYETAVRLGYSGTEEQWTQSLRYDHSEEFAALAEAVRKSREAAAAAADTARAQGSRAQQQADRAEEAARLSITQGTSGAVPGDVFRVKAVDSLGQVTAWEPVPPALAAGTYQLIEQTVTGEEAVFYRDREPEGRPYSFSALRLLIDCTGTEFTTSYFNFTFWSVQSDRLFVGDLYLPDSKAACIYAVKRNGRWFILETQAKTGGEFYFPRQVSYGPPTSADRNLGSFVTGGPLPKGTTVRIEAIRE